MEDVTGFRINESLGWKMLPRNLSFSDAAREADDNELRRESELRHRERCGTAFVPIEEVPDPDSLDPVDAWARREAEENEGIARSMEENTATETVSDARRIPPEIQAIIARHSLPPAAWNRVSGDERRRRTRLIEHELERYYVKAVVRS